MTHNPDLVIRGGNIADGLGGELFEADVAIKDGRIIEVGRVSGKGREEIDAKGKLVAPGFVDVHTHYDGQVTWSQDITPSSQNGVTTAIMGNCGVGFAPCRPSDHVRLIQLMEGVEDIPEPVLSAGIPWAWESFPDYMDWLSQRSFDMDIGAQLPHAALRVYVMGARGAIPLLPKTTARWRRSRAMPCAPARWVFRPRAPSTTAPLPATSRRR
jgi:N-acyl-D-aspartate/D-glutamate deacylase